MNDVILILTTTPDRETAERIASSLLEEKLAACVNIVSGLSSMYWWKGKIQHDEEFMLFIKSTASRFEEIRERVVRLHPYELPELIALPIMLGLDRYLAWVQAEASGNK
jgi:periplasmic divalent cation tolerance protein